MGWGQNGSPGIWLSPLLTRGGTGLRSSRDKREGWGQNGCPGTQFSPLLIRGGG